MPALISLLTSLFGAGGAVATFFVNIFKKITLTSIILPIQISLLLALYVARISFLTALTTLILWFYNRLVVILDLFNSLTVNSNFSTIFLFLQSIGVTQAINEVFAYFSVLFVSILTLFISKIIVSSLQGIADEYFKIGVLIQLGLK